MKKMICSIILIGIISLLGFSQAVLPTSSSFTTTVFPTGWTAVSVAPTTAIAYYSASGNTPPALKFDGTGDKLTIHIANAPGNLTYFLTGNSFSGGTFVVEESIDGSAWATLHTHTSPTAATYTEYTDVPSSSSRYIRFNYTNKVTGNIGLDDVSIAEGAATPEQEINVQQSATTIVNGGTYMTNSPVGTLLPITFAVQNLGTGNSLNISSVVISGANAADFAIGAAPTTVAADGSENLVINFTPSVSGTRVGVITINNDDTDEGTYVINVTGIGGLYATEPTSQPTNLSLSSTKTYRLPGTFTAASGAEGYLVLRKLGSPITDVPADGTSYMRGDAVGSSQVVFSSNATSFSPNNIVANSTYYFSVFAYNGSGIYRNYLTTAPLTASVTTPVNMIPVGLYDGISTSSPSFMSDLQALINPHFSQYYSSYGALMVTNFAARDTTNDQRVVTCVYSGENRVFSEPFDWTTVGFSREHSYCHNWMPSNPADSPERPEYADYHHLFPTNQNNVNALRSNFPLGVVVTPTTTYMGCKFGLNANGKNVFEPQDSHKGDAARAIMYMCASYNTVDGYNWKLKDPISGSIPYGQDQAILKAWHFQDPPSNWEIARNDYVDSLQGNRNPFVDSIQFACFIDFALMSYELAGCSAGLLEEKLDKAFSVFPVPSNDVIYLQVSGTEILSYEILDMQSRIVVSESGLHLPLVTLKASSLKHGAYFVKVETPYGAVIRKMVIE